MLDFIIGQVTNVIDGNTFVLKTTHYGTHNILYYKDHETVRIADTHVDSSFSATGIQQKQHLNQILLGRRVKCNIRYRDQYNVLIANVEYY